MTKIKMKKNSFTQTKEDKKNKNKNFKLKYLNQCLFVLAAILSVYYVIATNDLSIKGFELNALKKNINELSRENENFKLQTMSMESYNNLNERVAGLNMVAVDEIVYISAKDQVVVKK